MIGHEHARRSEVLYARPLHGSPAGKRATGCRRGPKDDLGRERMPYDLFMDRPSDWVDELADAFGGREGRDVRS